MTEEGGAMAVAMSAIVAVVAVLTVAVAALGALYAARAQATNAADAAALAAAVATYPAAMPVAPVAAARSAAEDNRAALVSCVCPVDPSLSPRTVVVVAAVRAEVPVFGEVTVRAASRAEFDPLRWLGGQPKQRTSGSGTRIRVPASRERWVYPSRELLETDRPIYGSYYLRYPGSAIAG